MSNFLKQFDNNNDTETEKKAGATSRVERAKQENGSNKIVSSEHIVERDDSHHKRKLIRYGIIGGSILVVCLSAFLIFRLINQVAVKEFIGTSISEAKMKSTAKK